MSSAPKRAPSGPRPNVPALLASALLLVSVSAAAAPAPALTASGRALVAAAQPARVARLVASANDTRTTLGLHAGDGFVARSALTSPAGTVTARLAQTYQGYRVWGAELVSRERIDGTRRLLADRVERDVAPSPAVGFGPDEAVAIALRELDAKGPLALEPAVEVVVFPTHYTGGLQVKTDPYTGRSSVDTRASVVAPRPAAAFVWAYEVRLTTLNATDGVRSMAYVVDARGGAVLHKADLVMHSVTPAEATGHSQYSGDVTLHGSLVASEAGLPDGYALWDPTRGLQPNPFYEMLIASGQLAETAGRTGLRTTYLLAPECRLAGDPEARLYAGNSQATWGDGAVFALSHVTNPFDITDAAAVGNCNAGDDGQPTTGAGKEAAATVNGQTAAVDAHFGVTQTWDFYDKVFHRHGMDGAGTSVLSVVHFLRTWSGSDTESFPIDNASWVGGYAAMIYGDGSYPWETRGFRTMTDPELTGHEMTHGVTENSAALDYAGEPGGLNEGTSDFLGVVIRGYGERPAGAADNVIPEDGATWTFAAGSGLGTPLRWLYKPSKDGMSPDAWYQGLSYLDVHNSSGPFNRFAYFLSQGASSDSASETYSPYLPGGMTGIGNDRAARIWYETLTGYLPHDATYPEARTWALEATADLYGSGGEEYAAVENAFAAIAVGAAHGASPPVAVSFPSRPDSSVWAQYTFLDHAVILPLATALTPLVNVENATNPAVSLGFLGYSPTFPPAYSAMEYTGIILPDGRWATPSTQPLDFAYLTAISVEDPLRFATALVQFVDLDVDRDGQGDCIDMGGVAIRWNNPTFFGQYPEFRSPSNLGYVNDLDVAFFTAALPYRAPLP